MVRPKTSWAFWFLLLFATPFLAVGAFAAGVAGGSVLRWLQTRSWVETPARILQVDLDTRGSGDDATYLLRATYEYAFGGRTRVSEQVAFGLRYDNVDSFHRDKYEQLRAFARSREPFRCFVDPERPDRAVLYRALRPRLLALEAAFALLFGGAGAGIVAMAVAARRRTRETQELRDRYPASPWRWRREWADGHVRDASHRSVWFAWGFALFWNLISAPVTLIVLPNLAHGDPVTLIALLFPAVGLALLTWAVRASVRWWRFGGSVLLLTTMPGVIGGELRGRIDARLPLAAARAARVRLTLRCLQRSRSGRSASDRVVWQDGYDVPAERLTAGPVGVSIPVDFRIPPGAGLPSGREPGDPVRWVLAARAHVPGVDYLARFTVPVFRVAPEAARTEAGQ